MNNDQRAQRYRDRADYMRRMAREASDVEVRDELQKIARQYDALADNAGQPGSPA